jgi:hypothetical protein
MHENPTPVCSCNCEFVTFFLCTVTFSENCNESIVAINLLTSYSGHAVFTTTTIKNGIF